METSVDSKVLAIQKASVDPLAVEDRRRDQ